MKPSDEQALIAKAKANAPSYLELRDDGAPMTCKECGFTGLATNFILTYTPNGKTACVHRSCIDEWWIEHAKNMGKF